MSFIAFTTRASGQAVAGGAYISPPGETSATFSKFSVPLPTGVTAIIGRPSFCSYQGDAASRLYIVGAHTDNLVLTENFALLRQGILPPENPFVVGAGSGSAVGVAATAASGSGRTGACVCYIRWYDATHVRRSPLSGASPEVTMTGQALVATNLPTTCSDPSVTHIETWVSMDGNAPRFAVRRDLGTVNVTEEIPTLQLGEAYSEDYEKFPRCRYNLAWHDRQVMSGDDRHPDRIYFSLLDDFENYGGFYVKTRKGQKVVGLYSVRDNLFVSTASTTYVITGYTENDIIIDVFEPDIGAICHHGVQNYDDLAIVPTRKGFYLCNGSDLRPISVGHEELWKSSYALRRTEYEDGWAVVDMDDGVYKFCIGSVAPTGYIGRSIAPYPVQGFIDTIKSGGYDSGWSGTNGCETVYWVLDLKDLSTKGPQLSFDVRERQDRCATRVSLPGSSRDFVLTGSADGYVRKEGVEDETDDSDDFDNAWAIITKHYGWDTEGVSDDDGWRLIYVWTFGESIYETSYMFFGIAGTGHEFLYDLIPSNPSYPLAVETVSTAFDTSISGEIYEPIVRTLVVPDGLVGSGFTFMVYSRGEGQIYWRGLMGKLNPSSAVNSTFTSYGGS
jgi:hypothetical protein